VTIAWQEASPAGRGAHAAYGCVEEGVADSGCTDATDACAGPAGNPARAQDSTPSDTSFRFRVPCRFTMLDTARAFLWSRTHRTGSSRR
jgi:hypothetical protein